MSKSNVFFTGIIAVLVVIILLQRACTPSCKPVRIKKENVVRVDTAYVLVDNVLTKTVTRVKHDTVPQPGDTVFLPSKDYHQLKLQYLELSRNYSARNIYKDTLKLDSLGFVYITDTLQYNTLSKRKYHYSYQIPVITKIIQEPPRRQVYIGGGIAMNAKLTPQVNAGFLYKNKRDQIYGIYTGISTDLVPVFGVSTYWKISFRKK